MAYIRFGNRVMKYGNAIFNSGETFVLKLTGTSFPQVLDETQIATVTMEFSTPEIVSVNYGNGTIINYTAIFQSAGRYKLDFQRKGTSVGLGVDINRYNYPDGQTLSRVVSFSFNKSKLNFLDVRQTRLDVGDFLFEITKYPALKTFNIAQTNSIQGLNLEGSFAASVIENVLINNAFDIKSRYYSSIPSSFFLMPLKSLGIGSLGMGNGFLANKFDQIYLLANTLTRLLIQRTPINDTNFGQGALPSNFSLLTNLSILELIETDHTIIPNEINSIPSLTYLSLRYNQKLVSWGNLPNLVNLRDFVVDNSRNITTTLPAYFSSLVKLKLVDARSSFYTQIRVDSWVDNWYDLISTNAVISGANTLPFRGMTYLISKVLTTDPVPSPSGIYQQPAGYVQGVSNGTPTTPKEKIWVMTNQYGHVWTTV